MLPPRPECPEAYTYEQGAPLVCPVCGHEWTPTPWVGFGRMQLKSSVVTKA
ncbi:hypothetical protein [Gulosibacter sp. ACHW.36C]|uniref:hypothetical protein n=1 Tax=Gulosibacter sp. ACHW.36C TaxID=3434457 RepID=UPI0032D58097